MPHRTRHPGAVAVVGAALVALGLLLVAPAPASAHAVLERVTPADGATVAAPPDSVTLTFDEAVGRIGAAATLTGPRGGVSTASPVVAGKDVQIPVTGAQPAGSYQLSWRVVSDDGHPVSGEVRWTVHGSAAAATLAASPTVAAAASGRSSSSGTSWYAAHGGHLLLVWVVVVLGGGYLAWDAWRRRAQRTMTR